MMATDAFRPIPRALCLAICLGSLLAGCANLAPDYQRPTGAVSTSWPAGPAYRSDDVANDAQLQPARDFFRDPRLSKVLDLALANNRDLREAVANIESARALYREQRSERFPSLTAGASGSRGASLSSSTGRATTSQSYTATVGLSAYEIDLFGRVRNLTDAARETWLSNVETQRSTRISVIGETASAWLTLAADQSLLALAQQTVRSAQDSVKITQARLDEGVVSRVDLREAESVLHQARVDVASDTTTVAQDRNALEVLVGARLPDELLPDGLPEGADQWLGSVQAGLPSSILQQRPDVMAAEHDLKSAYASVGAARAALYPSLSLTAEGGVASTALAKLFAPGAATVWSLAPSLSLPLLDAGANQASIDYAKAQQSIYLAKYESTLQTAFQEVADALARRGTITEQLAAQRDLVNADRDSYQLADARYREQVDSYLNVLDSQRSLYSAEQTLISTRLSELSNRVTLYRTLGGGLD